MTNIEQQLNEEDVTVLADDRLKTSPPPDHVATAAATTMPVSAIRSVAKQPQSSSSSSSSSPARIKLHEVNSYLTCWLCKGYLVDATTISECLHSFCRSCIIKFLQANSHCPECNVVVNKAKPNLKLDKTLQDIVYKLVPELYVNEMTRRRQFYAAGHPTGHLSPEQRGDDTERIIFNAQDKFSLCIEYISDDSTPGAILLPPPPAKSTEDSAAMMGLSESQMRRYLQCPGMCRVDVLKKFVRNKYNVDTLRFHIDILHKRVPLPDHYTLIDIAYIYSWKRNAPMKFFFRITDIGQLHKRFDYYDTAAAAKESLLRHQQQQQRVTTTPKTALKRKRKVKSVRFQTGAVVINSPIASSTPKVLKTEQCAPKVLKTEQCAPKIKVEVLPPTSKRAGSEIPPAEIKRPKLDEVGDTFMKLTIVPKEEDGAKSPVKLSPKPSASSPKSPKLDIKPVQEEKKVGVETENAQQNFLKIFGLRVRRAGEAFAPARRQLAQQAFSQRHLPPFPKMVKPPKPPKGPTLSINSHKRKLPLAYSKPSLVGYKLAKDKKDKKERKPKIMRKKVPIVRGLVPLLPKPIPLPALAPLKIPSPPTHLVPPLLPPPPPSSQTIEERKVDIKSEPHLKNLLNTCKIPSSLSITCVNGGRDAPETLMKPVINHIEILKLPEVREPDKTAQLPSAPPQTQSKSVELPVIIEELNAKASDKEKLEKVGTTMQLQMVPDNIPSGSLPKKDERGGGNGENTELSITITMEKPKVVEEAKVGLHPNLPKLVPSTAPINGARPIASFQKMFEETLRNPIVDEKAGAGAMSINKRVHILDIASKLFSQQSKEKTKETMIPPPVIKEKKPKQAKVGKPPMITNAEGKVAIPRLKKPTGETQLLANLHSNALAMNYSVSVSTKDREENVVTSTTKIEPADKPPMKELNVSVKSPSPSAKSPNVTSSSPSPTSTTSTPPTVVPKAPKAPRIAKPKPKAVLHPMPSVPIAPKLALPPPSNTTKSTKSTTSSSTSPTAAAGVKQEKPKLDVNQLQEKYNIQNLAQVSASFQVPGAFSALQPRQSAHPTVAAIQQAMLMKMHQNWLSMMSPTGGGGAGGAIAQYEKYLQSLGLPSPTTPLPLALPPVTTATATAASSSASKN